MGLQVDTVFVWVSDLGAAVEWYRELGLETGPLYGTWQVMEVSGETRFALHHGVRPPGPSTAVVSLRTGDLQSEIERLARTGITPIDEVTDTGTARFVTFLDPDGNAIQLLER